MITLRRPNISDAELMLGWENDPDLREELYFAGPYELQDIVTLIEELNSPGSDQLRFLICSSDEVIGAVDLCEIQKDEAFVSILIADHKDRNKGYAFEALQLMEQEAKALSITHLKAWVRNENLPSVRLFKKLDYTIPSTFPSLNIDGVDYLHIQLWSKCLRK